MDTFTAHAHPHPPLAPRQPRLGLLNPLRRWIDQIEVRDRTFAHRVCQVIPCCCPFERTFSVLGREVHIPPLCELNPIYDELVGLRFRSLNYLADVCEEDITRYICD